MTDSTQYPDDAAGFVRPLAPGDGGRAAPPPADEYGTPGWAPADPFGTPPTQPSEMTPWQPEPVRDRRGLWIGGAIIGVVVIAAIAGVVWFRNLVGDPLGSARSIPPQAQVVITLDGLQLINFDEFQSLIDAFADPAGEPGVVEEDANMLDGLDEGFEEAFGVDFRNGVLPWVGRTASFAMWDLAGADLVEGSLPELMLAIEVRDAGKAEDFLDRVMDAAAAEMGTFVEGSQINDQGVLVVSDPRSGVALYGAVAGDVMIFTGSDSALRDAIGAHRGSSIVDSTRYGDALAALPADRLVTAYMDGSAIDDFADLYGELAADMSVAYGMGGLATPDLAGDGMVSAVAGSFALIEEGLQFDTATVYRDADDAAKVRVHEPDLVDRLPADTLAYLAFPFDSANVDDAISQMREAGGTEFDQITEQLEAETGIDVFEDLLPAFDDGLALAAYATGEGMLGRRLGGFGLLGAVGVADREPVADALARLDELIESELATDPSVSFEVVGDLRVAGDGVDPMAAWGLGADVLVVGSSVTEVEGVLSGQGGGVHDAALYQELDGSLPGEGLVFYLDVGAIVDLVDPPPEVALVIAPLRGAGAAGATEGNVVSGRLVVAIDY
jgi:hypothetical protein